MPNPLIFALLLVLFSQGSLAQFTDPQPKQPDFTSPGANEETPAGMGQPSPGLGQLSPQLGLPRPDMGQLSPDMGLLSTERPELIDDTLVLRGQLIEYEFTQPETRILLNVDFQTWEILAPSAVELRRLGWTSDSLFAGELVEVEAVRQLGIDNQASLRKLTRSNGQVLTLAIEEPQPEGFAEIPGGMYKLDRDHTHLLFGYDHLGFSQAQLKFERIAGDVFWNSESPADSIIQIDIDASSLRSGIAELDEALRTPEFFDTLNYPKIQFTSTELRLVKWGELQIIGQLQIKDIAQPAQMSANLNKVGTNPLTGVMTVGISAQGTLNRSAWNLSSYLPMIGDQIEIALEAEFMLSAPDIAPALGSPLATPDQDRNPLQIQSPENRFRVRQPDSPYNQ